MALIPELSLSLHNTWLLSILYLIISIGLVFLIPKHNVSKFVKVPKIKYVNEANYVLYYGFIVLSIFIPIKIGTVIFYIGISFYIIGILLYFTSIFYFAISEYYFISLQYFILQYQNTISLLQKRFIKYQDILYIYLFF